MPNTRTLTNKRIRIADEQGHLCYYCGRKMSMNMTRKNQGADKKATLEHLKRKVDGGTYHVDNIVVACQQCNCNRGDYSVETWKAIHKEVIAIRVEAKSARKAPGRAARQAMLKGIPRNIKNQILREYSRYASKHILPDIREKYWQLEEDVLQSYLQTQREKEDENNYLYRTRGADHCSRVA